MWTAHTPVGPGRAQLPRGGSRILRTGAPAAYERPPGAPPAGGPAMGGAHPGHTPGCRLRWRRRSGGRIAGSPDPGRVRPRPAQDQGRAIIDPTATATAGRPPPADPPPRTSTRRHPPRLPHHRRRRSRDDPTTPIGAASPKRHGVLRAVFIPKVAKLNRWSFRLDQVLRNGQKAETLSGRRAGPHLRCVGRRPPTSSAIARQPGR